MDNMKPPKELYNVVRVQKNTKMCKILKCNRVALYLNTFATIIQKICQQKSNFDMVSEL